MIQHLKYKEEAGFELCNFQNTKHREALCRFLNDYMSGPMGNFPPHNTEQDAKLANDLEKHPTSITLFILEDDKAVGLVNAFMNYSTFHLKPFINIHDVFVEPSYRGRGLSRKLIKKVKEIAQVNGCCKLTLEVRNDNPLAQGCYRSEGFKEGNPPMLYWECFV